MPPVITRVFGMISKSTDANSASWVYLRSTSSKNPLGGLGVNAGEPGNGWSVRKQLTLSPVGEQLGTVTYFHWVWSMMSYFSQYTPAVPRTRQSSGVLKRSSWLLWVFLSCSFQVVLGV